MKKKFNCFLRVKEIVDFNKSEHSAILDKTKGIKGIWSIETIKLIYSVSYPRSQGCSCTRIRQLCRCRFRCSDSGYLDNRPRSPHTSHLRTRADTRT